MAEITLRAYLQEIDDLVEHEQLDEAIAHCRHVLQIYPKHLETYRLLGKSYLEAKRYGDAADLFQRVLSAIPDDFVAHIGMSIVREDEGNLDASIWHMERAFETNPANPAIQQELRRLIGRRDGLEPHKVRLTRGALARMYAHGELYPQAIAELRSALQEDTDRPDLQTLLAEMYWRTEQRAEAAEVCTRLLEKLPYCRDALRIIAAALHAGGQVDDAAVYHRRLASLDPYTAFLDTAVGDSKSVEAGAVKVEKFVWHPGQPLPMGEAGRPQWTTTPAAATSSAAGQAIPGWLSALDGSPAPVQAPAPVEPEPATGSTVHPFAGAKPPEKAEVPEWMQQAGWAQSSGQAADAAVSFSEEEMERLDKGQAPLPPVGETELQPADIPDWLQKIAPSPEPRYPQEPSTRPSTSGPSDLPDWLGEFAGDQGPSPREEPAVPVSSPAAIAPAAPTPPTPSSRELPAGLIDRDDSGGPPPGPAPSEQVPTWLETPADGATETIVTWLGRKDIGPEVATPMPDVPAAPAASPNPPEDEVPSWVGRMKSSGSSQPAASVAEGEGLPSWLSGVAEAASQEDSFTPADMEAIRPSAPALPGAEFEEEPVSGPTKGETPDWLKAMTTTDADPQATADVAKTAEPTPEEPPPPDWMTGVPGRGPASRGIAKEEATPAWLRGTDLPAGLGALAPSSEEAEPEWLRGTGEPEAGPSAPPDWMRGIAEAAAAASPVDRGSPVDSTTSEPEIGADEPVMARDVSAAETMISMRREPPAEETSVPPAESPAGEPPEWLREFASIDEPTEPTEELAAADVPSWLRSLGQTGAPSVEPELPEGVEETSSAEFRGALDWLQETASEVAPDPTQRPVSPAPAPSAAGPPDLGITEPVSDDEVFRWLEDLASRQTDQEPSQPGRPEPETESVESAAPISVPASALEPSLDWLDTLAEPEDFSPGSPPYIVDSEEADLAESAADEEWLRDMAASPSPPLPTDLWDKLDTEETVVSRAPDLAGPGISSAEIPLVPAPVRPAADETVPGSPRQGLAGPRRPPDQPVRPPQTTPLTEGEVVEWLRQTASGGKPASGAEGSIGLPETDAIPIPADQAAGLAVQLVQAGRAALSSGDVPAALQAYAPVIERGLLLNSVIEDLRKAVELRPEATAIWQALGDAYKKANMLPEAIKAFSRALKEEDGLEVARQALAQGDFALAVVQYGGLIKKKRNLETVIGDLREALDDEPRRPPLWQALGDAYMKANRLPEAIDAYRRGMESV